MYHTKRMIHQNDMIWFIWYIPMYHSRGVQPNTVPDQLAQLARSGLRTIRPDVGDNQRWVSTPKTRDQRVDWRVWAWKTNFQPTWSENTPEITVLHRLEWFAGLVLFDLLRSGEISSRSGLISLRSRLISSRSGLISLRSAKISSRSD